MLLQNNTIFSPAKLNLGLKIPFRYANGYHHLESIFLAIDWGDTLHFSPSLDENSIELINETPDGYKAGIEHAFSLPESRNNLVIRAIRFFQENQEKWGLGKIGPLSYRIKIHKRIPSPCGLGGGSSNAASVLKFLLAESLNEPVPKIAGYFTEQLCRQDEHSKNLHSFSAEESKTSQKGQNVHALLWNSIATESATLGSDIPFFLSGKPAYLSGKGAGLAPIAIPPMQILLGIPPSGFSTPALYASLQKPGRPTEYADKIPLQADEFFNRVCIPGYFKNTERTRFLENDFWEPASRLYGAQMAEIERVLSHMCKHVESLVDGVIYAGLTGSGSAVFVAWPKQNNRLGMDHDLTKLFMHWHFVQANSLH